MKFVFDTRRSYGRTDQRFRPLGAGYYLLLAGALGLLILPTINPTQVRGVRVALQAWSAPAIVRMGMMLAPLRAGAQFVAELPSQQAELQRLRRENRELRGWQWRAQALERKIADLRSLARAVRNSSMDFVTAQVLSVNPSPARHLIVINVGAEHGVRRGDGVINGDGLVGIVADVARASSQIQLVDDPGVQLDVSIGRAGVLGHTSGALDGLTDISVWHRGAVFRLGDEVVTSGSLPGVPRGLKVGMIIEENSLFKVSPLASLGRLEFVSVLIRKKTQGNRLVGVEAGGGKPWSSSDPSLSETWLDRVSPH